MKKALGLVLGLLIAVTTFAGNKQFDTMVIFGDSTSDNGNLYRYLLSTLPVSPPYYEGHFSNGPLWVEQLYDSYYPEGNAEGFQDYAVGGAGAVLSYKQKLPFTLAIEISNYLYWHTYGKKDTTLYTLWIGANNYLNGPTNIESITDSVVAAIGNALERLIITGGNKFFVINLPDLGNTPHAIKLGNQELVTELVSVHNYKLAAKVEELKAQYPEVTFIYFDVYSILKDAVDHASELGFSNVTDSCYLGGYTGWLSKSPPSDKTLQAYFKQQDPKFNSTYWNMIETNPQLKEAAIASYLSSMLPAKNKDEAASCDGHVFWDAVHPTTKAHSFIAQKARELIDAEGLEALSIVFPVAPLG
jgi:phospholipase/lecithinase/hemolysin